MRFSDLAISKLRHDGTQKVYYDAALPNFGVRIGKRRKTWLVLLGNQRKRVSIGHFPRMPLKEARNKAANLLNIDPDENSPSVIDTIRRYSEDHLAVNTRPATALVLSNGLQY